MRTTRVTAVLLGGMLLGTAGCALQWSHGDEITVIGPVHVRESRTLDPGLKRAARLVEIRSLGIGPSFTSLRMGLSVGYVDDRWIDVYAFDEETEALRCWAREGDRSSFLTLFGRLLPPPDSRMIVRIRGTSVAGAGINLLETGLNLAAGYSDSTWMTGDADAPPVAFALPEDGGQVLFIPAP